MRVLVTGGSGFIGAWAIRQLLAAGHEVRIFDLKDDRRLIDEIAGADAIYTWVTGDITDTETVWNAVDGCDAIIHLAGVLVPTCRENPIRGAQINLIGTLNVFEAAKRSGKIRGISYASTAAVFGPDDGKTPYPITHYGAYKLATEGTARAYFLESGISSVGIRPLTVYGPGRDFGMTAGPTLAMRAAALGEPYTFTFTGSTGMDWCEDTAYLFVQGALAPLAGAHVFSQGDVVISVDEMIATIKEFEPNARIDAAGEPLAVAARLDQGNLDAMFPARPKLSFREGTRRTIDHYKKVGKSGR